MLAAPGPRDRMLVTPEWLAGHLHDANLVLLHVGDRAEYDAGHIPGARYISLSQISGRGDLSLELPPVATLDSAFESMGISDNSRIVIYYGNDWISPTTRVWFTLDYLGLGQQTSVLDGGMRAWTRAGRSLSTEPPVVTPGRITPRPRPGVVVSGDWVRDHLRDRRIAVVDARDAWFYDGLEGDDPARYGHIPGARSVPYTSVVDDSLEFLSEAGLKQLFQSAGVEPGRRVVPYCHVGQQATAVVFAARLAGYDAALYDGSFQEWGRRTELPVEGGVAPTRGGLISTADLAARLARSDVSIVDLRSDLAAYLKDHIPGAVFLHYETLRATGSSGSPADLLSPESYAAIFSRLGLRRDRPVVIYASGDAANFNATFLAWILAGFRQEQVYLLDGGYDKWSAEGRPLTRAYPAIRPTEYNARPFRLDVTGRDQVRSALGKSWAVLLDARPPAQFSGEAGPQMRRGHIPGAVNHPWSSDLVAGSGGKVWKSVEELRAAYGEQGIDGNKFVIAYCNTGTEASHLYFALHFLLGRNRVRVYVPSWTEWAALEELPIETGS
ncbi:MAG: sulfurtransferase [Gemmatimonadales bacterium]